MRSSLTLSVVLAMMLGFTGGAHAQNEKPAADGVNDSFPFQLFQEIAKGKQKANVLISPLSVSTALGMTYAGAGGETKSALAKVLNFAPGATDEAINQQTKATLDSLREPGGDTKLEIANAIIGDKNVTFKQPFLDTNTKFFDAEVQSLDFKAPESVNTINSWVSKKTHEKIPTILSAIAPDAILYLINAIYFKGTWENKFEKSETREQNFNTAGNGTKKVQMMHDSRSDFRYMENDQFQAVRLPYADKRLSMYVFLPKENQTLLSFETNLSQSVWQEWMNHFRKRTGEVGLPRFKIADSMEMTSPLSALGLDVAFSEGRADFSEMVETAQRVFISKVLHKTFMEVNEEGTEAAAVTAIEMSVTSAPANPVPPFVMIVDRPFFIALSDEQTGKILFAGHIANP
ncbi:MAG: serpin family protein [Candidatus Melainabacteria bacterium]|nr:serpin family protein [Candidatus Melainabacteria bacterium]